MPSAPMTCAIAFRKSTPVVAATAKSASDAFQNLLSLRTSMAAIDGSLL
jgi:hypothetical protein